MTKESTYVIKRHIFIVTLLWDIQKNSFKVKYFKNGIELSSLFYLEIAIGEKISALAMLQASQPAAFVHCSSL